MEYTDSGSKQASVAAFKSADRRRHEDDVLSLFLERGEHGYTDDELFQAHAKILGKEIPNSTRPARNSLQNAGLVRSRTDAQMNAIKRKTRDGKLAVVRVAKEFQPVNLDHIGRVPKEFLKRRNFKDIQDYYQTPEWRAVRAAMIAKAGGPICEVTGIRDERVNTHHKVYDHLEDEINHLEDLMLLLPEIHEVVELHYKGKKRDGSFEAGLKAAFAAYRKRIA